MAPLDKRLPKKADRKPHRERKNPAMRDKQAAARRATNAARPKQHWNSSTLQWEGRG